MLERFQEAQRAIAYLCSEMRRDNEDAKALITWYPKGHLKPRAHVTDSAHMVSVLEQYCVRFSEAVAVHGLRYGDYPVGAVQCRCFSNMHHFCPSKCHHHFERPIVTVLLFQQELALMDDNRETILHLIEDEINRQVHAPADRIGRHGSGACPRRGL